MRNFLGAQKQTWQSYQEGAANRLKYSLDTAPFINSRIRIMISIYEALTILPFQTVDGWWQYPRYGGLWTTGEW